MRRVNRVDKDQPGVDAVALPFSQLLGSTGDVMGTKTKLAAAMIATVAMSSAAVAGEPGQWVFRMGAHDVAPKSGNHEVVNVDAGKTLTFNLTRMFGDHWGLELLAALPFEHDINLNSGGKVADVKQLPPTLSLQYHFAREARVRPYVGAGLNATIFFSEHTTGALAGTRLELDTSFGAAAQAGIDVDIGNAWFLNADARWVDIDTDAALDGASLGTVQIDPLAIGLTIGRRF
jgi:outer membrane protein